MGYAVIGMAGLAIFAGVMLVISAAGNDDGTRAHIDQATGSTNGIQPDTRAGIDAPPLRVTNLKKAAKSADCELRLHLEDEGHKHLPLTAPSPNYGTRPPTSGNHVESPYQQADGAYGATPKEVAVVHSLEHGRLTIQYRPDLPRRAQLELIAVYDTMWGGTLIFPNDRMPYEVAATAWTNLIGCDAYKGSITLDAIRDFGKTTWGRYGGEPVSTFDLTAPTPVEPADNRSP